MESTREQELEQKVRALEQRLATDAREQTPQDLYATPTRQLYKTGGTERPDASLQQLRYAGNKQEGGIGALIALYSAMGNAYQQMAKAFKHGTAYMHAMQAYASPRGAKPAHVMNATPAYATK